MQGLEEARRLYLEQGQRLIHENFPEYEDRIAVGLVGRGSECFGFDDELSRDHDYTPGFCLWLDDETHRQIGIELSRLYRMLPRAQGQKHSSLAEKSRGVMVICDFYRRYTGSDGAPRELMHWLSLPSHALAEASNGQVWRDDAGIFTDIREQLLHAMPEDVWLKKLAAKTLEMAQSGQYNYSRSVKRREQGAAMLALSRFVTAAADGIYILNRRHAPYYKWLLRGMDSLNTLGELKEALEFLLTADNDEAGQELKCQLIEDICAQFVSELQAQKLSHGKWDYLEPHAFQVQNRIVNRELRSMHIMDA